ncbi:MAG: hypothetical protein HYY46_03180 [Deltaproteobacteria bacterium]|nr:hypothetical protein [Deltaproteobacteria bacterium]
MERYYGKERILARGKKGSLRGACSFSKRLFLRRKYPQYRRMAIQERPISCIRPSRTVSWGSL